MKKTIMNQGMKKAATTLLAAMFFLAQMSAGDGNRLIRKFLKTDKEQDIKIEQWMVDLTKWADDTKNKTALLRELAELDYNAETRDKIFPDEIILEEWMLNASDKFWDIKPALADSLFSEEEIPLEDWMTDLSKW
ncbi:MAG: hypothetical protein JXB34_11145 [Bacteroidales bacterium]|nr:hypothetical protein [Bacteroidales bacterium]